MTLILKILVTVVGTAGLMGIGFNAFLIILLVYYARHQTPKRRPD